MNEPRRLKDSAGSSQRLLDSASLDKPGTASRQRVAALMSTESAFSKTSTNAKSRASDARTLLRWCAIAAAATVVLAFGATRLTELSGKDQHTAAASSDLQEIGAEPMSPRVDVPSHGGLTNVPSDELAVIEAARRALRDGRGVLALSLLDDYERRFADGTRGAEAVALRLQVLQALGRATEAKDVADAYSSKHRGPLPGPSPR
jgi:hypothetical protein